MRNLFLKCILTALFFVILISGTAVYASNDSMTVTAASVSVEKGSGDVKVPIILSGNKEFVSLGIEISYDDAYLTLTNVEFKDFGITGNTNFTDAKDFTGPCNLNWSDYEKNVTYSGEVAVLHFKVAENAPLGEYPLTLGYYKGPDGVWEDGKHINFSMDFETFEPTSLNLNYVSGGINIKDSTGKPISALGVYESKVNISYQTSNGKIEFTIDSNYFTAAELSTVKLRIAEYDSNGVLVKLSDGVNEVVGSQLKITADVPASSNKYKIMLWEDDSCSPMINALEKKDIEQ